MAAAVSDFTPQKSHDQKLKKNGKVVQLMLEPTKDILKELGSQKKQDQILVGFALETENEVENAQTKLKKKNLDMVVLNSLNDHGAGFETDTNKITIIHKHNEFIKFELKSKEMVAIDIVDQIETHLNAQK
jgi:phosphopantothenoylcysteine decarboxylase/phosphopantothenate--cysteine ligase